MTVANCSCLFINFVIDRDRIDFIVRPDLFQQQNLVFPPSNISYDADAFRFKL